MNCSVRAQIVSSDRINVVILTDNFLKKSFSAGTVQTLISFGTSGSCQLILTATTLDGLFLHERLSKDSSLLQSFLGLVQSLFSFLLSSFSISLSNWVHRQLGDLTFRMLLTLIILINHKLLGRTLPSFPLSFFQLE